MPAAGTFLEHLRRDIPGPDGKGNDNAFLLITLVQGLDEFVF